MFFIAKTDLTTQLESSIYNATAKMGTFTCFEVTIGIGGSERVDYITFDTKGIWRCFEIKVSLADFKSNAKKSFYGNFNYYVLTKELYEKVKDEIPSHIGVYIDGHYCKKRAKKQNLGLDEQILKDSMIRSLCRESNKLRKIKDKEVINRLEQENNRLLKQYQEVKKQMFEVDIVMRSKYGRKWKDDFLEDKLESI
ncbi:hypothetical protein MKY91_20470 [Alkalicoccobacillus gibsonii]|uniref:MmcB family DNA repair protein n=1 Tax=Alkalicoccobacillus gibsonii TaxID=79881 RepID=A0ABU9VQU3_9BACI